ncbi:hypothetical protein AgCh_014638 [Apium graveolens]
MYILGISAAVFTEVYNMLLNDSAADLLLFMALGIPITCLAIMYLIRACTPASEVDSSEHIYFLFAQAASITLAVYLLTTTILKHVLYLSKSLSYILVGIMVILLMSPLAIPIKMTIFPANNKPILCSGTADPELSNPVASDRCVGRFSKAELIPLISLNETARVKPT